MNFKLISYYIDNLLINKLKLKISIRINNPYKAYELAICMAYTDLCLIWIPNPPTIHAQ